MNLQDFKDSINKFSVSQMCSNNDGKTSMTGTMGGLCVIVGCLCFLLGVIDKIWITKTTDVMLQSLGLVTLGSAMLGVRKAKQGKSVAEEATIVSQLPDQK